MIERDKLIEAYQILFRTHEGQIVLEDLKSKCYYNRSTLGVNDVIDTNGVLVREGMRNTLLYITSNINTNLQEFRENQKSLEEGDYHE